MIFFKFLLILSSTENSVKENRKLRCVKPNFDLYNLPQAKKRFLINLSSLIDFFLIDYDDGK